jgi:hypothetical protein
MSTTPPAPQHLTDFLGVLLVVLLQRIEKTLHARVWCRAKLCERSWLKRTPRGQGGAKTF